MNNSSQPIDKDQLNQSFIKIYKDNYQWLTNWFFRNLKSNLHLEDLVQDTFLKVFTLQNAHLIREPKAYLATTARGILIDHTRHEIIERKYLEYLAENPSDDIQHSPEDILANLQILHRIAMSISELPERQRVSLLLYYLEGRTQLEIADQLGISPRTVQNDLAKAMVQCFIWIQKNT